MGNCVAGATAPVVASPILKCISHSPNNNNIAVSANKDNNVATPHSQKSSDHLKIEIESLENRLGHNRLLPDDTFVAPWNTSEYKKQKLHSVNQRIKKKAVLDSIHSSRIPPQKNQSFSRDLLSQKSPHHDQKGNIYPNKRYTTHGKHNNRGWSCRFYEDEDVEMDDIETADCLLNELIEYETMEKSIKKKAVKPANFKRPKTRRGLLEDDSKKEKRNISLQENAQLQIDQRIMKENVKSECCHLKDALVMSASHKTIMNKNRTIDKPKPVGKKQAYDEAELRMIGEIEREFAT